MGQFLGSQVGTQHPLSPVIKLGIRHPRKKDRKVLNLTPPRHNLGMECLSQSYANVATTRISNFRVSSVKLGFSSLASDSSPVRPPCDRPRCDRPWCCRHLLNIVKILYKFYIVVLYLTLDSMREVSWRYSKPSMLQASMLQKDLNPLRTWLLPQLTPPHWPVWLVV